MAKDQNNQSHQEQDLNQLLKVRREKLAALQEAGADPFRITKYEVTHHSRDIKDHFDELEGKEVSEACHGKGILLQRTGSSWKYPVLCGKRQRG